MIDFSPLARALATLNTALIARHQEPGNDLIRDACIQRFEYCFELCHKMLRRYLEQTEASQASVKELSYPDLFRLGSARNLVQEDLATWNLYRRIRNLTSHTYDADKAAEIVAVLPQFLTSASDLLHRLIQRQDQGP